MKVFIDVVKLKRVIHAHNRSDSFVLHFLIPDLRQNLSISMHFVPSFATVLLSIKDGLALKGISYDRNKDYP